MQKQKRIIKNIRIGVQAKYKERKKEIVDTEKE